MTEIMTMMIVWLVILIIAIAVEVLTMGLTSIWFAGGALAAVAATLVHAPIAVQIILFFVVSLLLLFFTRPVAVKYFNKDRVKTNVESLIGRQAVVISEIDNLQGIGQITVGGQQWSARSADDKVTIPVGAVVNVLSINGVKLIVKADELLKDLNPAPSPIPEPMSVSQMEELDEKQPK